MNISSVAFALVWLPLWFAAAGPDPGAVQNSEIKAGAPRRQTAAATSQIPNSAFNPANLEQGFQQPPNEAQPSTYYLMLNGYLNRAYAGRELEELAAKGIRGLCIFDMGARGSASTVPPAGPPFMSDAWLDQFAFVLDKAKELGMTAQLAVSSSWDMGASWVEPKAASMALYHRAQIIAGPAEIDTVLPLPEIPEKAPRDLAGRPLVLHEVALLAFPDTNAIAGTASLIRDRASIVNLSSHLTGEGRLRWTAPPGRWAIVRFVCANTGERLKVPSPASDGLATDHFSAAATRSYLQYLIQRLEARLGDLRQTALKHLYLPSYEVVGRIWTPDLLAQFQKYRGYDMTLFLPVLAGYRVEDQETSNDFLYDFRKTMGDLLVDAYYRTASETAHQAGLGVEAEAGGPGPPVHQVPVDALKALGAIDEMRGEFWPWRLTNAPLWVVKETASAAHGYGRRLVHMEAFTAFHHWTAGPYDLKFSADRAFGEGMNHVVWHTSSHQPPEAGVPGWVYGAGTHLTPNLVWWPMAKPFMDYLARCSYLLQQGLFVADVCYYSGDQGYNFVPPKQVDPALGFGYDYDVVNPEVILTRMQLMDGRLALPDGLRYELMVLPNREDFDPGVLEKLAELVAAGATLVGPKPHRATGLADRPARDQKVRRIAEVLWGPADGVSVFEHHHGKGTVVWGRSIRSVLAQRGVGPDFQFKSTAANTELDFIHRRTPEADIYFVRNVQRRSETVDVEFRVRNKAPEFWMPDSGAIRPCPVYRTTRDGVQVPLNLAPWESTFVVFRRNAANAHLTSAHPELMIRETPAGALQVTVPRNGSYALETSTGERVPLEFNQIPDSRTLDGPWSVHFSPGWGAPESVTLESLISWTDHDLEAIRYFSGIATYRIDFEIPSTWKTDSTSVELDLGNLWAVGTVSLNGQDLGVLWKPPFRVEVTRALHPGKNRLEVAVANTWANRLIGDSRLPADQRRTRTNITRSGDKPWKDAPLQPSGLFGPVRLSPSLTKLNPR